MAGIIALAEHWQLKPEVLPLTRGGATFRLCPVALLSQRPTNSGSSDCVRLNTIILIYYSCNHTSNKGIKWTDVKGNNSDVSAQSRVLFSE